MNKATAYNIAYVAEVKLGMHICLGSNIGVWNWSIPEEGYAVLKNTESEAKYIATNIVRNFTKHAEQRKKDAKRRAREDS